MKVLSLFDWMACGYEALLRAWITVDKYYASEIDKYAMASFNICHGTNFETTDICEVKGGDLGITDKSDYTYVLTYSFP